MIFKFQSRQVSTKKQKLYSPILCSCSILRYKTSKSGFQNGSGFSNSFLSSGVKIAIGWTKRQKSTEKLKNFINTIFVRIWVRRVWMVYMHLVITKLIKFERKLNVHKLPRTANHGYHFSSPSKTPALGTLNKKFRWI